MGSTGGGAVNAAASHHRLGMVSAWVGVVFPW